MAGEPGSKRGGANRPGTAPRPDGETGDRPRSGFRPVVRRSDIEDLLSRLPGVLAVRLAVNDWGAIQAVHVLATVDRGAKQIVRDIESALQARFGLRLDHKKVSVAQVRGLGPLRDPVRPELSAYVTQTEATTGKTRVEVVFRDPRDETTRWEGAATGGSRRKQQAHTALVATLEALRPLLVQEQDLELIDCDLVTVAGHEVLVGVFALPDPRSGEPTLFAGAAPVGTVVVEAAVRVFLEVYEQLLELRDRRLRQSPVYRLLQLGRQMREKMVAERAAAEAAARAGAGGGPGVPAAGGAGSGGAGGGAPGAPGREPEGVAGGGGPAGTGPGTGDEDPLLRFDPAAEAAVSTDLQDPDLPVVTGQDEGEQEEAP